MATFVVLREKVRAVRKVWDIDGILAVVVSLSPLLQKTLNCSIRAPQVYRDPEGKVAEELRENYRV
jgi:hypothetical protein